MREITKQDGTTIREFFTDLLDKPAFPAKESSTDWFRKAVENKDVSQIRVVKNVHRNQPCPCGSGNKFKRCCISKVNKGPIEIKPSTAIASGGALIRGVTIHATRNSMKAQDTLGAMDKPGRRPRQRRDDPAAGGMAMRELINEVWALRGGEHVRILPERPEGNRWIAVGLFSAALPPGPRARARGGELPSEDAVVLGCKLTPEGEWQWVHLSSATKEAIGDLLFDEMKAELDRWYYCVLTTAAL